MKKKSLISGTGLDLRRTLLMRVFVVSQWYQRYTNIVQGFTNGTNVNTICTNGNVNGTIGSPNCTISANGKPMVPLASQWYHWLSIVPLVKLTMVPFGEPRTEPICIIHGSFLRSHNSNMLIAKKLFLLVSLICFSI